MTPDELERRVASLEAILFAHGEPLSRAKIAAALGIASTEVDDLIKEYASRLSSLGRGFSLLSSAERVQLVTKPDFAPILERFIKEEVSEDLTPATLETLAIVAYLGPLSRAKIEYYRGVNSSFTLRNLLLRGLISRIPDPDHAQSYLYESSFDLLKHLGIKSKEDLPQHEEFLLALEKIKQEEASAAPPPAGDSGKTIEQR